MLDLLETETLCDAWTSVLPDCLPPLLKGQAAVQRAYHTPYTFLCDLLPSLHQAPNSYPHSCQPSRLVRWRLSRSTLSLSRHARKDGGAPSTSARGAYHSWAPISSWSPGTIFPAMIVQSSSILLASYSQTSGLQLSDTSVAITPVSSYQLYPKFISEESSETLFTESHGIGHGGLRASLYVSQSLRHYLCSLPESTASTLNLLAQNGRSACPELLIEVLGTFGRN